MPFAECATGARLHYEDKGKGPTVIAIHGFMGTARDDLGTVIDWLGKSKHIIAPTLRGYGLSTPQPRRFSSDFYQNDARDSLAFMDALGIEKAHLIGYSDGGETALIMASQAPERFHSVAVWGAVGYFGPIVKAVAQTYYPPSWLTQSMIDRHSMEDPDNVVKEWVEAISAMVDSGGDISYSRAHQITCPLLMMLGHQDTLNPSLYAQRYIQKARQARLEMFDCGHSIHLEARPAFEHVLGDFLKTHA